MAFDIEDLTTFYANLPSIFERDSATSIPPLSNVTNTTDNSEKTYQPMFGSFLFAESEPFSKAAFITSTFPSIELKMTQEERLNEDFPLQETIHLNSNHVQITSLPPLAPIEDIDEDDFDGIPIRHASTTIKKDLNDNHNLLHNHLTHNNLVDKHIHDDHEYDDDSFLNDFQDELPKQQNGDCLAIPFLHKDIPDIDDLNEHEEDNEGIPFDDMDILDQSDSIRSSSPDSLLSSSHLDDEDDEDERAMNNKDDDDNDDEDVTQWNDDFLLQKSTSQNERPNAPLPSALVSTMYSHDQVNFIDSSRSNSRCSDLSSHLSLGYADQEQIFIDDDDGFEISSDSDSDHDSNKINTENDLLDSDNDEELSLQVNLDYHSSHSSARRNSNSSIRSLSPTPDQSPIVAIDDDINDTQTIQSAPLAMVDDDDDDDDSETFTSDQPVLPIVPLRNLIDLKTQTRQNDIVHDIVNIRHLLDEHKNDDEFMAVMHNPTVFEEVLFDDNDQQNSDFVKQICVDTNNTPMNSQLSDDNQKENESLKCSSDFHQTSSTKKKNSPSNITTTNSRSPPPAVNHFLSEAEEENVSIISNNSMKQKKEQQSSEKNTTTNNSIKQIINSEKQQEYHRTMSSDDESDDDLELLTTLAQLHGLVHSPRLSSEINSNHNETVLSTNINDRRNNILFNYAHQSEEENTSSKSSSFESFTSFNDQKSYFTGSNPNVDVPTSLLVPMNRLNNSILSTNLSTMEDLQVTNTKSNQDNDDDDLLQHTIKDSNDNNCDTLLKQSMLHIVSTQGESLFNQKIDEIDSTNYTNHLNDNLQPLSIQNLENIINEIFTMANIIPHGGFPIEEYQQSNIIRQQQMHKHFVLFSVEREIQAIVNELVSTALRLALYEINRDNQQEEHFVNQVLAEPTYEIDKDDVNKTESQRDDSLLSEYLPPISNSDNEKLTINERLLDPFDQIFDSVWTNHFEMPTDENPTNSLFMDSNRINGSDLLPITTNHIQEMRPLPLPMNPFDATFLPNDLLKTASIPSVRNHSFDDNAAFQDNFVSDKNEPSITTDEKINEEPVQVKDVTEPKKEDTVETTTTSIRNENDNTRTDSDDDDDDNNNNESNGKDNFFGNKSRSSNFDVFASEQPLNIPGIDSIAAGIDNEFENSAISFEQQSEMMKSTGGDDEPWELEDSGEARLKPILTNNIEKNDSYSNFFPNSQTSSSEPVLRTTEGLDNEETTDEDERDNYDDYFPNEQPTQQADTLPPKTVRFDDDNMENVAVLTPKDSLEQSESSDTPDNSDEDENEDISTNFQTAGDRITDHMDEKVIIDNNQSVETTVSNSIPRPDSQISLTDSEDLPPPLPPLPPLNKKPSTSTDNIPSKSSLSNIDLKRKINLRSDLETASAIQTTTDTKVNNMTDTQLTRSYNSAILRSTSTDNNDIDPDEVNDMISCTIDNNQVNIDAKTISPFKCVIGSAGQLQEDNQTAIIAIYGCWLPDHRLREYRYIMDQLFYYVYHKLETLVINDYILIYFHGATPKHRTPDFKILRKYYQMINFRLRKNLRAVYIVHPTRWLRTVVALSRPFFSNKFYNKVNYIYTIAELERQFPHNHISLPVTIEQADWLYSQKYDRQNASIKRSIERSVSRRTSGIENESVA